MIEIVRFNGGRYGLRNIVTGIVLSDRSGRPWQYRTIRGAVRRRNKVVRRMNKTFNKIAKNLR